MPLNNSGMGQDMNTEADKFMKSTAWKGSIPGLSRLTALLHLLGDPQNDLKYIHVTGTNGKGSVCAMLAAVFMSAGYRTGLFTSPCLEKVNEQIAVNGEPISNDDYLETARMLMTASKDMEELPTEFELLTAAAILFFKSKSCDIVIMEAGMGGTHDATNVIPASVAAVITSIGYDHMQFLGNTLTEIAANKAGIIKKNMVAICAEPGNNDPSVADILKKRAADQNSGIYFTDMEKINIKHHGLDGFIFDYGHFSDVKISMAGEYQLKNTALVLETVDALHRKYPYLTDDTVKAALYRVSWPARFEVIQGNPLYILDGGHNSECIKSLAETFDNLLPGESFIFVTGIMADKDYESMYGILQKYAKAFVAVTPDNRRALPAEELKNFLIRYGKPVLKADTIPEGLSMAEELAGTGMKICVTGSLYMMGEVRRYLYSEKKRNVKCVW